MLRVVAAVILMMGFAVAAEPQWERIDGCSLVQNGYRDGDSFLVRVAPRTFRVFRLYFVDTCEDSADQRYPERIAEQAQYFGISPARALELGDIAAAFSTRFLARPFSVWTCWQKAPGASSRPRYYALITGHDGHDLGEALVADGLARIYGKRVTLPDGTISRDYLGRLGEIEKRAKLAQTGAWAE